MFLVNIMFSWKARLMICVFFRLFLFIFGKTENNKRFSILLSVLGWYKFNTFYIHSAISSWKHSIAVCSAAILQISQWDSNDPFLSFIFSEYTLSPSGFLHTALRRQQPHARYCGKVQWIYNHTRCLLSDGQWTHPFLSRSPHLR